MAGQNMAKDAEERAKRRKKDLEELLTSKDYYSLKPVLDADGDINVIWGQRSNGKTYSTLKYALENYKKNNRTFVYVRRWAEDITVKNMAKLFSPLPIEDIFGPGAQILFARGAFILVYDNDPDHAPETVGWAICLNQVAHTKSQTFSNAQVVILDEFLQLKSERVLKDEFDAWEQTLSTVLRTTNDAKIFIIGNSVSKYSPYFTPYGIDPNRIAQGEVQVIELPNEEGLPTRIVANYCSYNKKVGKKTSKYVRGSKMAKTGEWEIEEVANIPHCDNEQATEHLLCSMFDHQMNINLGIFLRYSKWVTLELRDGLYVETPHAREFLVIRQTDKRSSYYHLTNVKDLTYSSWNELGLMLKDIEENCEISIPNELYMGRVYAEDSFVADYFYHTYMGYLKTSIRDLL